LAQVPGVGVEALDQAEQEREFAMPPKCTPKEFTDALRERRSRTTKALDMFIRKRNLKGHPRLDDLRKTGHLNKPLPKWIRDELTELGVKHPREFVHINDWPNTQKEEVRKALVHAIEYGLKIDFFWGLWDQPREGTVIEPKRLPRSGKIKITFYSPQQNVRLSTAKETFGHIFVDVSKKRSKAYSTT
jgi:hypothetical protein